VTGPGFYPDEGHPPGQWNWSSGNAEMYIHRQGGESRSVELTCVLRSLTPRQVLVRLRDGPCASVTIAGAGVTAPVRLAVRLQQGWNRVRFETSEPAVQPDTSADSRRLAFMVAELQVRDGGTGSEPGSR
jgi:hypothetical protein